MKLKEFYKSKYTFKVGKKDQKIWSWYRLAGIILEIIVIILIFSQIIYEAIKYDPELIWFDNLHFFTQQSNLIVAVFVLTYCFNSNLKIFKNNNWLIATTAYITITCLVFILLLMPVGIVTKQYSKTGYDYLFTVPSSIVYHLINPVYMVCFYSLCVKFHNIENKIEKNNYKFIALGLIYPACYFIYASFLPFVKDLSVYGTVTNLNPNFEIWTIDGMVKGNPLNVILFFFVLQLFVAFLLGYKNIIRKKIAGIKTNILRRLILEMKSKKRNDNNDSGSQKSLVSSIEWLNEEEKEKFLEEEVFGKE